MAQFPERWLEELKSKADIVTILGKYMYLQRKGNKFWACCPFHNEKTASFVVNPEDQYYHCFGCGKSGNVITFLMEHEKKTYPEAIEYLAKELNMEIPESDDPVFKEKKTKRDKLYAVNKAAARHYYSNLTKPEGKVALDYLDSRNISQSTRISFGIGCSIDGFSLVNDLTSQGFSKSTLLEAGLINEKGYDAFAKRLIIPIINAKGQVIGFGGRKLGGEFGAKYKNTSGTELFHKRKNLYNINLLKKTQAEEKHTSIILMEGYMDVISLYQAGYHNVVAAMGTSLTMEQCSEIRKYVTKVNVCFDGDAAGQAATWRSLDMLASVGIEVRVMRLPPPLDPDDCINKFGKEGFDKLIAEALPLNEFKIRSLESQYDLATIQGREKFALATIPVLAGLEPVSRETYAKLVSDISGLSQQSLITQVAKYLCGETIDKPKEVTNTKTEVVSASKKMGRFVLSSILELREYVYLNDLNEMLFEDPVHKMVYKYLISKIESQTMPKKGDLFDLNLEAKDEIDAIISSIEQVPTDKQGDYYEACITKLLKENKQAIINNLLEEIKTAPEEKQAQLKQELLKLLSNK